jgi:hypothetical protein
MRTDGRLFLRPFYPGAVASGQSHLKVVDPYYRPYPSVEAVQFEVV